MSLGSFFRKHKRCCFDKLMYVRSIGFTLRESTRYMTYSIMSITLQRYLWLRNTKYTRLANSGFGHSGTPSPPLPSILSPSPPSFPFPGGPYPLNQLWRLGERCKLTQWGLGQSHSWQTIWCISEPKGAALVATAFVHFHKNKFKLLYKHKTA